MAFDRLRAHAAEKQKRSGGLFDMLSCVACTSIYVALIPALALSDGLLDWIVYTLALSAITVILETLIGKNLNTLKFVAPPTTDDKISVSRSTASKEGDNVVSNPNPTDGSVAVKATTFLDN